MANNSNPQAERDRAERDKARAQSAKAATVDGDREAIDRASRHGAGPAGLNTGPSDTVSANPKVPMGGPIYGDQRGRDDGMGRSPPQGARPTSDRAEGFDPIAARANTVGSQEAIDAHEANQAERQDATDAEADADQRLKAANAKLADQQDEGEGDRQRRIAEAGVERRGAKKPSK